MNKKQILAALFDFDGVIMDTESQYSQFWNEQGKIYLPEIPDFSHCIKGTTLTQIFDLYFKGMPQKQKAITDALNQFEHEMPYQYIPGIITFLKSLREHQVKTAIVTSSNMIKMENVYRLHPELKELVDYVLTAELFTRSKPAPDCYLLGAKTCGVLPEQAIVFEDSFNGLKAGRSAGMTVVGLATTYPEDKIKGMADIVIPHFANIDYETLSDMLKTLQL